MTILTATGKGAPLTLAEADANLSELDGRTRLGWRDNIVQVSVDPNNPNSATLNVFRGGIQAYTFFDGEMTECFANFHIDHDYAPGTALYPHIHWACGSSTSGTVRWGVEYSYAKGHGQEPFSEPVTIYVEQTSDGTPYKHYVAEVSDAQAIPGTGIETDGILICRFFREGAHVNDTLECDAFVFCVDLHYQASQYATPRKAPDFFAEP
jgi:hypothetical protein